MSGFAILDLVIGLIFIFFLLSIMCSSILELIANFINMRANTLRRWFIATFSEKLRNGQVGTGNTLGAEILNHTLIYNLTKAGRKLSYVPKEEFAEVLFDLIVNEHRQSKGQDILTPYNAQDLVEALKTSTLLPEDLRRILLQHAQNLTTQIADEKAVIQSIMSKMESWYEKAQERVTGWYKRRSQRIVLFIAIGVTVFLNVDTISISRYLYQNPAARTALADAAAKAAKDSAYVKMLNNKPDSVAVKDTAGKVIGYKPAEVSDSVAIARLNGNIQTVDSLYKQLHALQLPIGWTKDAKEKMSFLRNGETGLSKITGWILTIMAISMGAPFWFDMLNKLVNIRGAGPAPNGKAKSKKDTTT